MKKISKLLAIFLGLVFCFDLLSAKKELNIYSYRHYSLDNQLFKIFEKETGIKVNAVTGKADALLKRLETEGKNSPADLMLTADAGRLYRTKERGLLQSVDSKILNKKIPSKYVDPDKQWFSFSKRARIVFYRKGVDPSEITTFEDLAHPKWKGRLMSRSSSNIYSQSLLSAIIAHNGLSYAMNWARGVSANFAKTPKGNDRDQMKAVANGIGDLAIANTYYMGKMINNKKDSSQRKASKKIRPHFITFKNSGGIHMNVSGAGVTKYAKNRENAIKFIEFLVSDKVQKLLMEKNYEYPVVKHIKLSKLLKSWGTDFKEDDLPVYLLGKFNREAVKTFDKAGWR